MASLASGCVVPLPYPDESVDAAAGNSPPVIRAGTPSMSQVTTIQRSVTQTFTLSVEDRDLEDATYVRLFRDYDPDDPTPPIIDRQGSPGGIETLRTIALETTRWCSPGTTPGVAHIFEVLVADRDFDRFEDPPTYRGVTGGGDFTVRPWIAFCED